MSELSNKRVAVFTNDLYFSYFNSYSILNAINITVNKGNIYGLLGPSGCGKTTLLKCILGRLKPTRGDIQLFGCKPGSPQCNIPGAGVGYMPQELALFSILTVDEMITYFGRIYSMNKNEIKERFTEIIKLLGLPQNKRIISEFSGGQKRRISLACALIHSPPLLILDEPTVGTDPMLRRTIWLHLQSLCNSGVTVILTTHYVEEVRNANVVAFMRDGSILAENRPNILLDKYMSTTMEELFLKLCDSLVKGNNNSIVIEVQNQTHCYQNEIIDDINGRSKSNPLQLISHCSESKQGQISNDTCEYNKERFRKSQFIGKCSALIQINFKSLTRDWARLFFFIIFPSIQLGLLLYSVGDKPSNINLAVFNEELKNNVSDGWGQLFVNSIDNKTFNIIEFDSFEGGLHSVEMGQTYAVLDVNERFTKALHLRSIYRSDADEETLEESKIRVHIDWSNQLVGLQIERYLYEAMIRFAENIAIITNTNPESIKIPLSFEEPVYGTRSESLSDFVLPSSFIILVFYATCALTGYMIAEDIKDDKLERSLVAGITAFDFIISSALTQFLILCLQIVVMLLVPIVVFRKIISGSFFLVLALVISQGSCGITYGLILAVTFDDIIYSAMVILVSFLVDIILSGVFWPIENMPVLIQHFGRFMPNTIPVISMRSIIYRMWTLVYYEVYMGFIVTYVWLAFFLIAAIMIMKNKY